MYYWEVRIRINEWDASGQPGISDRRKFPTALDAIRAFKAFGATASDYRLMHAIHGEIVIFRTNFPNRGWTFTFSDGITGVLNT